MKNTNKMSFYNVIMMMMVFVIIITVQNVGILKVYVSWDETRETMIKPESLVIEKFRVLLGLRALHKKNKLYNGVWANGPAPAPSPDQSRHAGPVPGPVPARHAHLHRHHRLPRPRPILPFHKFSVQHNENNKHKLIILIVVLLCTGVFLAIFAIGVYFIIKRLNRRKKTAIFCSVDRSKGMSAQTLANKVSHDTGIDMFYLNSLSDALEPEVCLREDNSNVSPIGNNLQHDALAEEIISVHEYLESSKNDSDDQSSSNGDKVVDSNPHLSEDESFHSFRNSNVSFDSLSDPVETFSPNQSNRSLGSPHNVHSIPPHLIQTKQSDSITDGPYCLPDNPTQTLPQTSSLPPPPPPPPPPPFTPSVSKKVAGNSQCSSPSTPKNQGDLSTIPPPPCPPLYLDSKGNSIRGPPAPPGKLPAYTPIGKDGNPLPKLKPLHWDKVRATPDRSMVWDKLRCSSFELDEETIESLFGYSLKKEFMNDEGKSKSPSPSKHVLEPKRLQNITILSKALNVTAEKACEALIQGDGLCTQQLEALIKMVPTKEEEAKLSDFKGEINELGSAEKLVKELLKIPYAFERVEAMLYKATFHDEVVHLRNSFSMLEEACKELRSNRLFLKLLEAVLKTGNRMNIGTIRGGAKAFKLDALLKLSDVKGTDGKTTLLHFVVQEIIRSEGIRMSDSIMGQIDRSTKSGTMDEKEDNYKRMGLDLVSGLSTELHNVKRTASLDLDVLATSVSNLSDEMLKLQKLVSKDLCTTNDGFVHVMNTFMSHAEHNLKELQTAESMVLLSVRQITEYYHGDLSKEEANPLRIFVVVRDFLGMLDQVCKELKTLKTPRSPNPLAPFR